MLSKSDDSRPVSLARMHTIRYIGCVQPATKTNPVPENAPRDLGGLHTRCGGVFGYRRRTRMSNRPEELTDLTSQDTPATRRLCKDVMAAQAEHTPGPWNSEHIYSALRYLDKTEFEPFGAADDWFFRFPGRKDADLIAAAPDMLEACKRVVTDWDTCKAAGADISEESVAACRAAIAKAEGGAS